MQGLGLVGIHEHARGLANVLGTMPLLQVSVSEYPGYSL